MIAALQDQEPNVQEAAIKNLTHFADLGMWFSLLVWARFTSNYID